MKDGSTMWEGVRNFMARNNLKAMKKGDKVLFYHSGENPSVVGIAKVTREFYHDPTSDDKNWVVVDLSPEKSLKNPVPLAQIKAEKKLKNIYLVRQGRLSVMPLKKEEYECIIEMSGR